MGAVRLYYAALWQKHRMDEYPAEIRGIVLAESLTKAPVVKWVQESLRGA